MLRVLAFYLGLLPEAVRILRRATYWWVDTLAVIPFVLWFLSQLFPMVGNRLMGVWEQVSPWYSLVPIGLLLLYGLLHANYERYERIEKTLAALKKEMTIGIDIPHALQLFRPSAAEPIEASGWMLFLQSARITNRSATANVSLGMTVHVRLLENARSLPRLSIREDSDFGLWKQSLPAGAPQYLRCPLNISPGQTVQGMVGFWVQPFMEKALGVRELDAAIVRRDDPIYGVRDAELEIIDYVSGEVVTIPVPGEYPTTKQTSLVDSRGEQR